MSDGLWISSIALLLGLNPSMSQLSDRALCKVLRDTQIKLAASS